jgi:hypothetical protein
MNKSGKLGRELIFFPSLILIIVIVIVFIVLVSSIGEFVGVSKVTSDDKVIRKKQVDSRIFIEWFLLDEIELMGERVKVGKAMLRLVGEDREKFPDSELFDYEEVRRLIIERFTEKYSCSGKNGIVFEQSTPFGKQTILKYPEDASIIGKQSKDFFLSFETYEGYKGSTRGAVLYYGGGVEC